LVEALNGYIVEPLHRKINMADLTIQPFNGSTTPACENCGSFEVLEIADKFLCADCVSLAGCGCGGSATDDE
jgi:hypothetical protein